MSFFKKLFSSPKKEIPEINITDLKDGCYFMTIKGDNIHETKKILIQK